MDSSRPVKSVTVDKFKEEETPLRRMSDREQEQFQLQQDKAQRAVDDVDAKYPQVAHACALAADVFTCLKAQHNEGDEPIFTDQEALQLVGPVLQYLK